MMPGLLRGSIKMLRRYNLTSIRIGSERFQWNLIKIIEGKENELRRCLYPTNGKNIGTLQIILAIIIALLIGASITKVVRQGNSNLLLTLLILVMIEGLILYSIQKKGPLAKVVLILSFVLYIYTIKNVALEVTILILLGILMIVRERYRGKRYKDIE